MLVFISIFFFIGVFLFMGSNLKVTGAFLGAGNGTTVSLTVLSVAGILIVLLSSLEQKIHLTSAIKKDSGLIRLAQEAAGNEKVKRELDHLLYELSKGNMEAGLGRLGHLEGTDIYYMRGRNGARLYFHQVKDGYEILGKSAKGNNQDRVIRKLCDLYGS